MTHPHDPQQMVDDLPLKPLSACQDDPCIWDRFFALRSVGELRHFAHNLSADIPAEAALSHYISTWAEPAVSPDDAGFAPARYLAPDRSAVMYADAPVILEGTNHWSTKPYLSKAALGQKLAGLQNHLGQIRRANPQARITLVMIPEKDHVISQFLLHEDRFAALVAAVDELRERIAGLDIPVLFDQPFHGIDRFQTPSDFSYKDSHLPGRTYVTVFGFVLETLGLSWAAVRPAVGLSLLPVFGDLAAKFDNGTPVQTMAHQPDMPAGVVRQTAGCASFADPLGDTWQEFTNDTPLVDRSVCILGDSHSSIFAQRKLTYLFASTFRETHFAWNPCGIRKPPGALPHDMIVLEISSRFVV